MLFKMPELDLEKFMQKLDDMEDQYFNPPTFKHLDAVNLQRFFYALEEVKKKWGEDVSYLPPCNNCTCACCYIKIPTFAIYNEDEKLEFIELLALFDSFNLNRDDDGNLSLCCCIDDIYY